METFAKMAELDHEQQSSTIRSALVSMGTNCDVNDDDPMGNGDQSRIATDAQREAARELFAVGGDMEIHFREQKLSPFCVLCVSKSNIQGTIGYTCNITPNESSPTDGVFGQEFSTAR